MLAPHRRGCRVLVFVASAVAFGCSEESLERYDDTLCRAALKGPGTAEAMEWLRISSNEPKHLGSLSVDESLAFVHQLDFAGARRVMVVGIGTQSRPSDLALVIELSSDPKQRLAVFELYAKAVRRVGYKPMADLGQAFLYLPTPP